MDLLDLGTERLSWRRFRNLVDRLPVGSQLYRDLHGDGWTATEHLLAAAVDALNAANWQRGNAGNKSPSPKPKPVPRPGDAAEASTHKLSPAETAERLRALRRRHEQR